MCKNKDYEKDQKYLDDMVDGFIKDMEKESKIVNKLVKENDNKDIDNKK